MNSGTRTPGPLHAESPPSRGVSCKVVVPHLVLYYTTTVIVARWSRGEVAAEIKIHGREQSIWAKGLSPSTIWKSRLRASGVSLDETQTACFIDRSMARSHHVDHGPADTTRLVEFNGLVGLYLWSGLALITAIVTLAHWARHFEVSSRVSSRLATSPHAQAACLRDIVDDEGLGSEMLPLELDVRPP